MLYAYAPSPASRNGGRGCLRHLRLLLGEVPASGHSAVALLAVDIYIYIYIYVLSLIYLSIYI